MQREILKHIIIPKPMPKDVTLSLTSSFDDPQETITTYWFTDTIREDFERILEVAAQSISSQIHLPSRREMGALRNPVSQKRPYRGGATRVLKSARACPWQRFRTRQQAGDHRAVAASQSSMRCSASGRPTGAPD